MKTNKLTRMSHLSLQVTGSYDHSYYTNKKLILQLLRESLREWCTGWNLTHGLRLRLTAYRPSMTVKSESTNRPRREGALTGSESEPFDVPIKVHQPAKDDPYQLCIEWTETTGILSPMEKATLLNKLKVLRESSKTPAN